ncbi:MAG: glutamate--tRNA ligase [Syntrophomonadaceae bacterium]|nr:glutamate--tRNA ligase [Syntrophomonadaceae bacterium]
MGQVKVRFAPSPTGPLHIGGARSALFNYLFAAHYGGTMVLRIEDTDLERSSREYEEEIIESLRWLGIKWEEGVDVSGENGPYRQTERLPIYEEYGRRLIDSDRAYYCFCTEKELEEERQSLLASGQLVRYSGKCRYLNEEEIQEKLNKGLKPAVRFKVPNNKIYIVDDLVRGRVSFDSNEIGDFIIIKSDGIPTYNFAVVIDDTLMGITHVIRAEEHLSNTPRQLMLYDALNFKRPEFAHISLILGSDKKKMSKRHGATSLMEYRKMGYLPEAMFNFLALLGWSPEGEKEILSGDEIVASFSLERVSRSPAIFDLDKLNWLNQQYIKQTELEELKSMLRPYLEESEFAGKIKELDDEKYELLVKAVRDRLVCLDDIKKEVQVFFADLEYEQDALDVLEGEKVMSVLQIFVNEFPDESDLEKIQDLIKSIRKRLKLKPKDVFMPLRCALSGKTHGPELPYLISIWGREESLRRINQTVSIIEKKQG